MYVLIDPISEDEIGIFLELDFVREIDFMESKAYEPASFSNAQAFFLNHILYQIEGRDKISNNVTIIRVEELTDDLGVFKVYTAEKRSAAFIDYISAMTGIDLPDEEIEEEFE